MQKSLKVLKKSVIKHKIEVITAAILVVALTASLVDLREGRQIEALWQERREKERRLEELVDLSIQYPDYRDLLYRLAISQWELGNDQASRDALARARYLDPNNPLLLEISNTLGLQLSGD